MFIITCKSRGFWKSIVYMFRCGGWCLDSMIADLLLAFYTQIDFMESFFRFF